MMMEIPFLFPIDLPFCFYIFEDKVTVKHYTEHVHNKIILFLEKVKLH